MPARAKRRNVVKLAVAKNARKKNSPSRPIAAAYKRHREDFQQMLTDAVLGVK